MASSTPNRLLAMLNSATSTNPNPSNPSNSQANGNVPSGQTSPREPTPAPPAVSLSDLFKSIAPLPSRSAPSAPSAASPGASSAAPSAQAPQFSFGVSTTGIKTPEASVTAQTATGDVGEQKGGTQQNKLLGMLMGIGNPAPAGGQAGAGTEGGAAGSGGGEADKASFTETEAHKQVKDLLAGLRAGSPSAAISQSTPDVNVKTEDPSAEPKSNSRGRVARQARADERSMSILGAAKRAQDEAASTAPLAAEAEKESTVDPAIAAVLPPLPSSPAPPTTAAAAAPTQASVPPPAVKSPFTFVSPFDAFGPPSTPRSRTASSAKPAVPVLGHGRKASASASSATGSAAGSSVLGKRPGSALDKLMPNPPAPSTSASLSGGVNEVQGQVPENQTPVAAAEAKKVEEADVKPTKEQLEAADKAASSSVTSSVVGKSNGGEKEFRLGTAAKKAANGVNGSKKADEPAAAGTPAPAAAPAANGNAQPAPAAQPAQSGKGTGPKAIGQHTLIDLSLPNLDALTPDREAVHIVPAAILKNQPVVGFQRGRAVGVTQGWMAYALPAGKIRLIDRDSGSRIVLHLPPSSLPAKSTAPGSATHIADMAVTPTLVAAIGPEGCLTVFRVPAHWTSDDPPTSQLLHIPAEGGHDVHPDQKTLGPIMRVEIIDRGLESLIAICGPKGCMLVPLAKEKGRVEMKDLASRYKILTSEGWTFGFCLNGSQQAIALISLSSHLSIYSVASQLRVFHKPLPSFDLASVPTSVQFVETNLLIGRKDNTLLELVQITSDISILGTIRFSPGDSSDFCQAVYDGTRGIVWISSFARGSLYGFQYSLKGRAPIPAPEKEGLLPFSRMMEVPLEKVLSLAIAREASAGPELLFAHGKGVTLAIVYDGVVNGLKEPVSEDDKRKAVEESKKQDPGQAYTADVPEGGFKWSVSGKSGEGAAGGQEKGAEGKVEAAPRVVQPPSESLATVPTPSAVLATPATPAAPAPAAAQKLKATAPAAKPTPAKQDEESDDEPVVVERTSPKALAEETNKQLKKMEDRIVTQFRQALSSQIGGVNGRIDAMGGDKLAADITGKVEKALKGAMGDLVRDEVKKSILPSITSSIKSELHSSLSPLVSSSLSDILNKTLPKDLERIITPLVQQSVNKAVQSSVDRALQESMKKVVLPGITAGLGKMSGELTADLHREIAQMKKDLTPVPVQGDKHGDQLKAMAEAMVDLQRQIAALSEQVRSAPAPAPVSAPIAPPQAMAQYPGPGSIAQLPPPPPPHPQAHPQAPPGPTQAQLEDAFLSALSVPTVASTLTLLNAHYHMTDYLLPLSPGSSAPLSQAVLLTLFHRLALAINELARNDPVLPRAIQWERRVAGLLDPRSGETAAFYGRVVEVVRELLGGVVARWGVGDQAGRAVSEVLGAMAGKQ